MVDGAKVGHLFDDETNELKGHAAWQWVDDEPGDVYVNNYYEHYDSGPAADPEPGLEDALVALAALAVFKATPHVVRWLNEKAVLPVKAKVKRASVARKEKRRGTTDEPASERTVAFIASPTGVEIATQAAEIRMSRAEWQARFRAAEAADAFRDEQMRILAHARIDDDPVVLDAASATEELTARQFAESIGLLSPASAPAAAVLGQPAPLMVEQGS